MGYSTRFDGRFLLDRELADDHEQTLADLANEEHVPGEDGKPTSNRGADCVYCQWRPTDDGRGIEWDDGEKFYNYVEWLQYIIDRYLKPWGYALYGSVRWIGENIDDHGVIYVRNNKIEAVPDVNLGPSWDQRID